MNEQKFFESMIDEPNTGCRLWTLSRDKDGYGCLWFNGAQTRSHRVAWTLANGPIPAGLCVCHRCDTPACCNPSHLFLGTSRENTFDKVAKGRHGKGEASPRFGLVASAATGAKQSVSRRAFFDRGGRPWNAGLEGAYTQTAKANEKRRAWSTGRKLSAEARAKIAAARTKLSREQREAILNDPRPSRIVALEYGVGQGTVLRIRRIF